MVIRVHIIILVELGKIVVFFLFFLDFMIFAVYLYRKPITVLL